MISIIVPVYNAGKYIIKAIETVRSQTCEDWELILVDDCSTDGSDAVIRDYLEKNASLQQKIRFFCQEKNMGAAAARNRGLDEAKGRYIAFLDADDIWYPDKLSKEMQFMEKHKAGFVYSAYEFGDENGIPNGRMVRVPKTMNYSQALSRTIIFTSTVLIDTEIIDKELIYMPKIASEDTATWWRILKEGHIAYGLNQPLVIYRRPEKSLSSNKFTAVDRIWRLYKNIAQVSDIHAVMYFLMWAFRAVTRRFVADRVRGHIETVKRFTVVQLSVFGLVLYTAIYAYAWFTRLYPVLNSPVISQDGYYFGGGLKLYFRGHILILLIYFMILLFMSKSSGGLRTGYIKPSEIFVSETTALAIVNVITYFQLSLMRNWLMPVFPQFMVFLGQTVVAGVWALIADAIYRNVFPPRETLVIRMNEDHKDETSDEILNKFRTRQDRFRIMKVMDYDTDMESIRQECLRWYDCVVLAGGNDGLRKDITEFCYMNGIRVYMAPDLGDILIHGMDFVDVFDAPLFELREYSVRWEERVVKRLIDLVFGVPIFVLSLPYLAIKTAGGSRIVTELCVGRYNNKFKRYRFDDREDGGGVLSLINVIIGNMSLVGPTVVKWVDGAGVNRYRYRMKPGIIGYYQLVGNPGAPDSDRIKMDTLYVLSFDIFNDFKLMLQAVRCAFIRR